MAILEFEEFKLDRDTWKKVEEREKERKKEEKKKWAEERATTGLITPISTVGGAARIFAITGGIFAVMARNGERKKEKRKRTKRIGRAFSRNVSPVITITGRRVRHERGNATADRSG